MELGEYPRPKNDTGIGVHWTAGFAAAVGLGQIRDFWLPELRALGVKWVKIANHDGALPFAELLLDNDIMPIVRLYRPRPNPGVLDKRALTALGDYVKSGVRYFEFNNEPDLGVEWEGGRVPTDAPQIVARNAVVDMEAILQRGGYPGVPATAPGTRWDLVGEICQVGGRWLFDGPVWQAVHNYSLNHPLDYPYDAGNQQGAPYSREFYDRIAAERWGADDTGGDPWQGWSLERVNELRRLNKNPGDTAFDDASCWLGYKRFDQLIRSQLGRSLPILATENGYIVGERPDPRYPATTPLLHMAQTLEACRAMMGASTRYEHAPDYYFCTAFWLIANHNLGSAAAEWEGQAWYSARWRDGQLPIVKALKAETKRARTPGVPVRPAQPWTFTPGPSAPVAAPTSPAPAAPPQAPAPAAAFQAVTEDGGSSPGMSIVRCRVAGRPGWPVRIWTDGWGGITQWSGSKAEYGPDACEFSPLGAGRYYVELREAGAAPNAPTVARIEVQLPPNRVLWVRFEPAKVPAAPAPAPARRSIIAGTVTNGEGLKVALKGGVVSRQAVVNGGRYSFAELPAGAYRVALLAAGAGKGELAARDKVTVNGANSARVDFVLPAPAATKSVEHCLLVAALPRSREEFAAILRYVSRFAPAVALAGTATAEDDARRARHVTILAPTTAVGVAVEQRLRADGCEVHRITEDVAAVLDRLVASGQPY